MRIGTFRSTPSGELYGHSRTPRLGLYSAVIPLTLSMAALVWPFSGGKKVEMSASQVDPSAQGTLLFHVGHNNNTDLDMKVRFLAKPSSLTPPEDVYVVWFQQQGEAPMNEGELKVGKGLQGELRTETPYKRFTVFITAEQSSQVKEPMGPQVLTGNVDQD